MKKIFVLFVGLISSVAIFAQNEKKEGDEMAADENYSGAAMMYRLCMQQDEECLLKLIRLLYEEKVEPQFTNELYQLINPLAENGNAEAQFYLGVMFLKGFDTKDSDKSFEWIKKSAEQGNADAQHQLGLMYQKGMGIKQDIDEALRWYRKSMAQGNQQAKISHDELVHISKTAEMAQAGQTVKSEPATTAKKPEIMPVKKEKSKASGILFAAGGLSLAAGTAATLLVSKTEYDWSKSDETNSYSEIKKRNPVFLIAGAVVGGVCVGTGIVLKKKANSQPKRYSYDDNNAPMFYNHNRDARLYFVTNDNGAGFRLIF